MIESGRCVPGIDPVSFGLPEGTALRYERPADPLRPFLPAYAVLDSDRAIYQGPDSWLLPSGPKLWIVLTAGPISVQVRNRHYAELGTAVLYGATSRAMPVASNGGISIVVDLSPLGWARWFPGAADAARDRITPLGQLWPEEMVADLVGRLHACDRGPGVKAALDAFFLSRLPLPTAHEPRIAAAMRLLADPQTSESARVAADLGISVQTLLRLTNRYWGFGAKFVLRRIRFLAALTEMMLCDGEPDFAAVPQGYYDLPHFLHDARDFLGMTPRQFLAIPMPYLYAALRARRQIIGAPWSPLDGPMDMAGGEG